MNLLTWNANMSSIQAGGLFHRSEDCSHMLGQHVNVKNGG